jgi:hypothetical protein
MAAPARRTTQLQELLVKPLGAYKVSMASNSIPAVQGIELSAEEAPRGRCTSRPPG